MALTHSPEAKNTILRSLTNMLGLGKKPSVKMSGYTMSTEIKDFINPEDEVLPRLLATCSSIVAVRISNGYLVRVLSPEDSMRRVDAHREFAYCADHQAIADYIINSAARDKLGVGAQVKTPYEVAKAGRASSSPVVNY